MYRIRLTNGEEAIFKTVEELAQAVSSGVVSPTAEVFHRAGNRWLPINTHPDYRNLISGKRKAITRPSVAQTPPDDPYLPSSAPTRKSHAAIQFEAIGPASPPIRAESAAPFAEVESEPQIIILDPVSPPDEGEDIRGALPPGIRRPQRQVAATAIGVTGLLVAAGIAAVLLTRQSGLRGPASAVPPEAEGMAPAPESVALANTASPKAATPPSPSVAVPAPARAKPGLAHFDTATVVYPAPSKPLAPGGKSAEPPAAPPPRVVSRLGTTVDKMPSYYEAYADARAEMDEAMAYVDFRRVFAPTRFASADSIRAARRMVAAAGNILRVYRGREVMLEQTYRPGEPEGKGSLREAFEVAEASRGLLNDVESLFAILASQEGEVRYRDTALWFRNQRAGQAYSEVRRRILQTLSYLGDPAESSDRVTMPRLLRGFGSDRPPPAR